MPEHLAPHPDLAGYVLGVLEPEEAEAFEAHLSGCPDCRREVAELAPLPDALRQAAPPEEVPRDLEARTFARIERDARASRRGARLRWAGLAAAAVIVLGLVGFGVARLTSDGGPAGERIVLAAAGGGPAEAVAHVTAPGAVGRVIELEMRNLPQAPKGFHYELWFVGPGDAQGRPSRMSAGTFHPDPRGGGTARLLVAAPPASFPGLDVTLEPTDGNPRREGPVVLRSAP